MCCTQFAAATPGGVLFYVDVLLYAQVVKPILPVWLNLWLPKGAISR